DREPVTGYVRFDTADAKTVTMRIATSLISVEQARRNLELEIGPDESLESVRDRAKELWEEKLSVLEVEGASHDQLVTLYSNLYRLFLYPNSGFENTGTADAPVYRYASPVSPKVGDDTPTRTGARIVDGKIYVNNGFWDTYRTTWPAYALLTPEHAAEMIEGFVQQYKDGGWIARWSSPGYANLMTGTSSDVAFADALVKGVDGFDVEAAYEAATRNATVTPPNDNVGRKGLATSIFEGYTSTDTHEGFSWAMEGYVNDFGIGMMAKELAARSSGQERKRYKEEAEYFLDRAKGYANLFDERIGFFQGREPDGSWRLDPEEYDPELWGFDYTETNGWNMAFTVPHDGRGLANLYGGRERLAEKLDEFFSTPETGLKRGSYGGIIHEMTEARDVRMGQYGHSNQPSHHILYMYAYAGRPDRTQAKVREVLSRLYVGSEIGQGYPGDEDNGEMSAWWLFSALGFYPLQMGAPSYAIGSPLFTKATIHLENGRDLVISAPDNSARNVYVQGVKINGKRWNKTFLPHDVVARGGTIEFEMGPEPSSWGTRPGSEPRSLTGDAARPRPMADLTGPGRGTATGSDETDVAPLFDDDATTQTTLVGERPWVRYRLDEPGEAVFYTVTSGSEDGQDPTGWILEGSRDGAKWTTLDERQGVTFAWRRQTRPFAVSRPGRFSYYRLTFATPDGGSGAGDAVTVSEIELLAR
ncbi:MAG TPA: GH92 family glycosyl hydrolase, partial [Actinopolymorphaceae bacterium]